MTEKLLNCPFCGGDADISQIGNEATKTRGYEVKCRTFGCSTTKRSMVVKHTLAKAREWAVERWNARPRTEGPGEGEPVAWRVWCANGEYFYQTEKPSAFNPSHVQPLYASPIRKPEISRTILGDPCTLEACPPGLFIADAYNTLGMKSEYRTEQGAIEAYIVESGEFFWGDNPQTVERQRAQIVRPISHADAILNLAQHQGGGRG